MSDRKYFEEITNPLYIDDGDVILWPAETGKTLHLHGSKRALHKLGFSVGERRGGLGDENVANLTRDPGRPRLLLVTEAHRSALSELTGVYDMAIRHNGGTPVNSVKACELPLAPGDLKDGEYDSRTRNLVRSDSFISKIHPVMTSMFGLKGSDCFSGRKNNWPLNAILSWSPVYIPTTSLDIDGDLTQRQLTTALENACYPVQGTRIGKAQSFEFCIPALALVNAAKFGMKAFKLTQKGRDVIMSRYAQYYFSMLERYFNDIFLYVREAHSLIMKTNAEVKKRAKTAHKMGYRAGRSVGKKLKEVCHVLER